MVKICLLSSDLHGNVKDSFLNSLQQKLAINLVNYDKYTDDINIFYVQTGGTEGLFLKIYPMINKTKQLFLLTSKENNSLAAAMEISTFLANNDVSCKIIHEDIDSGIKVLNSINEKVNLGVIGKPSDWLIASSLDKNNLLNKYHIELIDIDMEELFLVIDNVKEINYENGDIKELLNHPFSKKDDIKMALKIYEGLDALVKKYHLSGFTLRCFDLISKYQNTGCLALAIFNKRKIIATCEGDQKSLLTMYFANKITGFPGFQANPSAINHNPLSITFAHCTIDLSMVNSYKLDTHFESKLGVAITGEIKQDEVTILKMDFDKSEYFCFSTTTLPHEYSSNLCRTQLKLQLDEKAKYYFLNHPIGNHHILLFGNKKMVIEKYLNNLGLKNIY